MNCNKRVRIPTLLHEMLKFASTHNGDSPNFECRAGWCQQCQCDANEVQERFGEIEYIVDPEFTPISGAILPCIARRSVPTIDVGQLLIICKEMSSSTAFLKRSSSVWAKSVSDLVGCDYEIKTARGNVSAVIKLSDDSVIIKKNLNDPEGVSESVVSLAQFHRRYNVYPNESFSEYYDHVGVECYVIDNYLIEQLTLTGDIPYVKVNNEVFSVIAGDVISLSGGYMRAEMIKRGFTIEAAIPINHSCNDLQLKK